MLINYIPRNFSSCNSKKDFVITKCNTLNFCATSIIMSTEIFLQYLKSAQVNTIPIQVFL